MKKSFYQEFRAVVDKIPQGHLEQLGEEYQRGGSHPATIPL
ncbi:hypothetical protein ACO21R_001159 [Campylobacter upsaliensis]